MKKLILGTLTLFALAGCDAPTSIAPTEGTITDDSGAPLSGLIVSDQTGHKVTTDAQGNFDLPLQPGKQVLNIEGPDGVGKSAVNVTQGQRNRISLNYPVRTEITLLHTNDTHGAIDHFPKIAGEVNAIREARKNVFLLNAGDNFSGNAIVDQHPERGKPIFDLWNQMGLNVMTPGNHEFDYGQEVLKKRISEVGFSLILANAKFSSGLMEQPAPYFVLKTENDLSITLLGLIDTSNNGKPATHPKNVENVEFADGIETAKKFTELAKTTSVFAAISHMGFNKDEELAQQVPELDVIIGGHSHTQVTKPKIINNALIAQAGDKAKFLGDIRLVLKNGRIMEKSGTLISIKDSTRKDEKLQKAVDEYNNNSSLNEVIGKAPAPISGKNELGCMVTDATAVMLGLDIVFQNNNGMRITKLNEGDITLKMVYDLLPFSNEIVKMELKAEEIRSLIAYSFTKAKGIDLQVSGLKYTVFTRGDEIDHIELTDLNGQPLSETTTFKVGMNSYIASSYQFNHADPGASTYINDNQAVIDYIKKGGALNYRGATRAFSKAL